MRRHEPPPSPNLQNENSLVPPTHERRQPEPLPANPAKRKRHPPNPRNENTPSHYPLSPERGDVIIAPPRPAAQIARRADLPDREAWGKRQNTPAWASKTSYNPPPSQRPSTIKKKTVHHPIHQTHETGTTTPTNQTRETKTPRAATFQAAKRRCNYSPATTGRCKSPAGQICPTGRRGENGKIHPHGRRRRPIIPPTLPTPLDNQKKRPPSPSTR